MLSNLFEVGNALHTIPEEKDATLKIARMTLSVLESVLRTVINIQDAGLKAVRSILKEAAEVNASSTATNEKYVAWLAVSYTLEVVVYVISMAPKGTDAAWKAVSCTLELVVYAGLTLFVKEYPWVKV